MTAPHHNASTSQLPSELAAKVRKMIGERGVGKTALALRTTDTTLLKLIEGPGLTVRARDRIQARALEVTTPVKASVTAGSFELSADGGEARGMFMHAEVSGADPETTGAILGSALSIAGFGR